MGCRKPSEHTCALFTDEAGGVHCRECSDDRWFEAGRDAERARCLGWLRWVNATGDMFERASRFRRAAEAIESGEPAPTEGDDE